MTLLFVILIGRIYYVQVIDGAFWYGKAKERWSASEVLTAKRGSITDRNGNMLAMDAISYNVSVNPKAIHEADIVEEVVKGLHDILKIPEDELRKQVTMKKTEDGEYYVNRELNKGGLQLEKEVSDQIIEFRNELKKELKEKKKDVTDVGIYLTDSWNRYYPRNTSASQVVGYLDREGVAKTGIEAFFDEQLRGENGYIKYEKDGKRVQLAEGDVDFKAVENGQDIALTIDSEIQGYVDEALRQVVAEYSPKSATAIAADPQTMEILAISNMPEHNPNEYWKNNANSYNHAVKSLYEPGSTFKIVTLAAAVEEGVFNPNDTFKSGQIKLPGVPKPIRDIKREGWGNITYLEGLKRSSNVAFVKIGYEGLGEEKLRKYYSDFGFGQKTGIELGGELAGSIKFNNKSDVARAPIGQGAITVTPIQQVAAVAAVANGGKLLQPHIVKSITDPVTKTTTNTKPKLVRQVISPETSRLTSEYLEQVVSDSKIGSGKNAYIDGYRVAGKTGTAQKVINGNYSDDKFVVSFIGYAPVDNPKIVVYIIVDEPNDPLKGGGAVAAPAFKEIVLKSLRKMGVAPNFKSDSDSTKKEISVKIPKLTELNVLKAKAELKAKAFNYEIVGSGGTVLQQIPPAGTSVHPTQRIYLITEKQEKLTVPDLTGASLRDALEITTLIGVRLITEGQGYIVSQEEEIINYKRVLKVVLEPPIEGKGVVVPSSDAESDKAAGDGKPGSEATSSGKEVSDEQSGTNGTN